MAATANMRTNMYGNNQNAASAGVGTGAAATVATANGGTNGVTAGAVSISGYLGTGTLTVVVSDTAKATADQINALSATTGVTATARTEVELTGFNSVGSYSLNLNGDNASAVTTTFTISSLTGTDRLAGVVSAINDQSAKTGINASLNSDGTAVVLTNATGNNIVVGHPAAANVGTIGVQGHNAAGATVGTKQALTTAATMENVTTGGYITLDSQKSFAVTSASNQLTTGGSTLNNVANLDVTTFTNSTNALKTVDTALACTNGESAKLGSLQPPF